MTNSDRMVLRSEDIELPTVTIKFPYTQYRDLFYDWLENHAIDMFKNWANDPDASAVFISITRTVLITDGQMNRRWAETVEIYQKEQERAKESK